MKQFTLKVIMMDDTTSDYFDEGGLRKVRKEGEKGNACYLTEIKKFNTEAERQAYIDGMYDITLGCWSSYAILDNRCRI